MNRRALPPGGDLLYGVRAIAVHLGVLPRQALHLVESGRLPTFRQGRVICGRRSTLSAWLDEQEATARSARSASAGA